jgi:translation initiation factor IF-3
MDTRPQGNRDNRVQLVYLNEAIKAPNIIILDETGENLGTFPRRRALEIAQEK